MYHENHALFLSYDKTLCNDRGHQEEKQAENCETIGFSLDAFTG